MLKLVTRYRQCYKKKNHLKRCYLFLYFVSIKTIASDIESSYTYCSLLFDDLVFHDEQVVAMSASWGDRLWDVRSVESFIVGVRMRSDTQVCFESAYLTSYITLFL